MNTLTSHPGGTPLCPPLVTATGAGVEGAAYRLPAAGLQKRREQASPQTAIERESAWRQLSGMLARKPAQGMAISRWVSLGGGRREVSRGPMSGDHVVAIGLRQMRAELSVGGRLVHRGRVLPGMYHITPPGHPAHAVFHGGYDALHLHVPDAVLQECRDATRTGPGAPFEASLGHDPVVERLARTLLDGSDRPGTDSLHVELVCLALMARLLSCQSALPRADGGRGPSPLPPWRLARVTAFIDANLDTTLGLADLAQAAGLTRMHFAAQFRAATGVRPHDYVQQRRIERAQALLSTSQLPLVQVALSTGFQTQSHFTTVFKRLSGDTPYAWRRSFLGADGSVQDDFVTPRQAMPPGQAAGHPRHHPQPERITR